MADLKNLSNWKSTFGSTENVQSEDQKSAERGGFLSAESAVLVAGPAEYSAAGTLDNLIPIGLVQQSQVSQSKQVNEIFEVGSRSPFFIPGRTGVRASLSRVLFDGPSLFYALYRGGEGIGGPNFKGKASDKPTAPFNDEGYESLQGLLNEDQSADTLGRFWSNLSSSVFNKPIGLGIILYDMEGQPYGGSYLEHCFIQTHNFGISANQTVLAESVSLSARRVIPIAASNLPGQ